MIINSPLYCSDLDRTGKKNTWGGEGEGENPIEMHSFDSFTSLLAREIDGAWSS